MRDPVLFSVLLYARDQVVDVPAGAIFLDADPSAPSSVRYQLPAPDPDPETGVDRTPGGYDQHRLVMLSAEDIAAMPAGVPSDFVALTQIVNGGETLSVYEAPR